MDIIGLLGMVIATTVSFQKANPVAGYLMYPYVGWVAFATALNAAIVMKNPELGWPKKETRSEFASSTQPMLSSNGQ